MKCGNKRRMKARADPTWPCGAHVPAMQGEEEMQMVQVEEGHQQQMEAQQMQAEMSIDQLLEQALAQPAAATMVEVPKPVVPRMRRLLQQCMAWFNASAEEHRRHPGKRVEEEVWRNSALLRLAPSLLL